MKIHYYVLILLCILISIESFATSKKRYYYAYDEQVMLSEVENKMIITCAEEYSSNVKALFNSLNAEGVKWLNDSVCIVTLEMGQREVLKQELLQKRAIKSIQPLYLTNDSLEMGITNEIVVRFDKNVSEDKINELHKSHSAVVKKVTDLYQLISVPVDSDVLEIANSYQLSGIVRFSHPNFIAKTELHQATPTDPYFVNQFYLHNVGQVFNGHSGTAGADINAPEAWNTTKGNNEIIIAVIDEGVTSNHPDLPNTRQIRLNGSNFADGNANDPSPVGDGNHGNSCSGVIAASHDNEGIAGIAPNCNIMPIRIPFGNYPAETYANAIVFAKNNGAHILSNSWGYGSTNSNLFPVIKDAIEDATINGRGGKGCVVVFSAGNTANHEIGNNGFVTFPSNVDVAGVLTVGASDRYDSQSCYSPTSDLNNLYNQIIDIVAPSHRAYSCQIPTETFEAWTIDIPGNAGYNPVKNNDCGSSPIIGSVLPSSGTNHLAYTGHFGGTSHSCPQVSAVAGLILSLNIMLTQQEVADIICSTARKAGNYIYQITPDLPNGTWNPQMGYGVLDAYAAVQAICATPVNFTDQTVTTNTNVSSCGDINVQNVNVQNGAKLTLDAAGTTTIEGNFEVQNGSELEVK